MVEQPRLRCGSGRLLGRDVDGDLDLADGFAHLDDLRGARAWVGLNDSPLGPLVRGVVVVGVAEHEARRRAMHDEPQVAADARRPEVPVLALVDAVELDTGVRGIELQVERGGLGRPLLVRSQPVEARRERVGDPELHRYPRVFAEEVARRIREPSGVSFLGRLTLYDPPAIDSVPRFDTEHIQRDRPDL